MAPAPGQMPNGCMCDHSASHTPGGTRHRHHPSNPLHQQAPSSLPIIGRRLPASSSLVLAGALPGAPGRGRSSWTRDHAPARNGQLRAEPQQQAIPTRRRGRHRARPARPLDNRGPHGCGYALGGSRCLAADYNAMCPESARPGLTARGHARRPPVTHALG